MKVVSPIYLSLKNNWQWKSRNTFSCCLLVAGDTETARWALSGLSSSKEPYAVAPCRFVVRCFFWNVFAMDPRWRPLYYYYTPEYRCAYCYYQFYPNGYQCYCRYRATWEHHPMMNHFCKYSKREPGGAINLSMNIAGFGGLTVNISTYVSIKYILWVLQNREKKKTS